MWTADEIAAVCYHHYNANLPKQGKPDPSHEWTLLAAVIKVWEKAPSGNGSLQATKEVVAMGTGTKCIGQSKLRKTGDVLNDSHAEVVAKRSFQRYLLHQLRQAAVHQEMTTIFSPGTVQGKWILRPHIRFIFFSSHTPCGDASIIPVTEEETQFSRPLILSQAPSGSVAAGVQWNDWEDEEAAVGPLPKRTKVDVQVAACATAHHTAQDGAELPAANCTPVKATDVHRTGAKCVPGDADDSRQPGSVGMFCIYQTVSKRTRCKPCSPLCILTTAGEQLRATMFKAVERLSHVGQVMHLQDRTIPCIPEAGGPHFTGGSARNPQSSQAADLLGVQGSCCQLSRGLEGVAQPGFPFLGEEQPGLPELHLEGRSCAGIFG